MTAAIPAAQALGTRPSRFLGLLLVLCLSLVGCKESLYSNLNEQEANEMLVVLAQTGIAADKVRTSDTQWSIEVEPQELPAAVEGLTRAGLPRARFSNLGEMFKREGIVSTPTEERVRFLFGISQELSKTLSTIDGVTAARVHIVIPENDPLADRSTPSSASVFLKHDAGIDLQPMLPAIKSLVLRSVEGLTFDTVYVSMFPTESMLQPRSRPATTPLLGLHIPSEQAGWINPTLLVGIILPFLLLLGLVFKYRQQAKQFSSQLAQLRRSSAMSMNDLDPEQTRTDNYPESRIASAAGD